MLERKPLCLTAAPYVIRMVRSGVSEAMGAEYVQMARLSGIPERRVVLRHALRNALAPTVQVLALTVQYLIGGIVIVETVFAYPGLGHATLLDGDLHPKPAFDAFRRALLRR